MTALMLKCTQCSRRRSIVPIKLCMVVRAISVQHLLRRSFCRTSVLLHCSSILLGRLGSTLIFLVPGPALLLRRRQQGALMRPSCIVHGYECASAPQRHQQLLIAIGRSLTRICNVIRHAHMFTLLCYHIHSIRSIRSIRSRQV